MFKVHFVNSKQILLNHSTLTHRDSLIAVDPCPSVFASSAVKTTEVPVALTGAVEKTNRPSLPVVPSVVRVLGPVWTSVHRDGHTLSSPRAGATGVIRKCLGGRTALSTPESLWCHTFSGELCAHDRCAHQYQKLPHDPQYDIKYFHHTAGNHL